MTITVAQLRSLLESLPDDAVVVLSQKHGVRPFNRVWSGFYEPSGDSGTGDFHHIEDEHVQQPGDVVAVSLDY